ncbi:hypothetical protein OESDEN_03785 [Oesophagostomum dentatum]|uniref:ADP-ribosylation factor family protein n=1 Tax=Oesophagostomum dentatum TaxID=61180 RepID=A0A0B1TJI7_OESDE|nr:hypothetical protein OESDEN_03785 [Oesophagostomum dentatum]
MIPTVGFNMRKITKGNVTIKLWDIGGQPRFRSMWERYCRGVNAIVFMVDAADEDKLEASRNELMQLLDKAQLDAIPVLVNLSAIQNREICCYSISCKEKENIGSYYSAMAYSALKKSALIVIMFCIKGGNPKTYSVYIA